MLSAHNSSSYTVKKFSGQKTDFLVDTCNAGAGTLAVTIDGPSKVSMDCTEVEEGYKVRYTPLVPGDYYISLKYNGYHIVGSPFKVKCKGDYSCYMMCIFVSFLRIGEEKRRHTKISTTDFHCR